MINYSPDRKPGVRVRVPATTANLGPGFDTLALALDLENTYDVWEVGNYLAIEVKGEGRDTVALDHSNLFYHSMQTFFELGGYQPSGLVIREHNAIPLARGLGSSAATIVGGLLAARYISGYQMDDDRLLDLACSLEGHGDNTAAAYRGGFQLCIYEGSGRYTVRRLAWPPRLACAVFIPELLVSTESAREVLPATYSREDAVHNLGNLTLLLSALQESRFEDMRLAMEDRLHQPYRAALVPGLDRIIAAANQAGAYGACLSGAGPSVIAFHDRNLSGAGAKIGAAMQRAGREFGLEGRHLVLDARVRGAEFHSLATDPDGTPYVF
ncbi:MAG: homoserine kinase [Candidatus Dormibacteria bacterium]